MSERAILAIDQGTTNTKALLVDEAGQIVARASRPLTPVYPQPAWVEQDAGEIWRSVRECVDEVLEARPGRRPGRRRDLQPARVGGGLGARDRAGRSVRW